MSETTIKLTGLKKAMARQMLNSWAEVPQFQLETEVDCTALIALRMSMPSRPSYTVMIVKAAANALSLHPEVNVCFGGDHLVQKGNVNIGVAVDTKRGLLVPVLRDVAEKTLQEVEDAFRTEIKDKAVSGTYSMDTLTGGTFTISNLGMYRINAFSSIVNAPESAILSVPRMVDTLYLREDGSIASKKVLRLILSLDHRAIDGATGARFLMELVNQLENPELLLHASVGVE